MITSNLQGAVGFSKYKGKGFQGFLTNVVKFFTEGKFSHTFIVVEHSSFGLLILEANGKQIVITRLSKYFEKGYEFEIWKCKEPTSKIKESLDYISKKFLEKQYGWLQCFGFMLIWFCKKALFMKVNNPFGGGVVCSELVLEYLKSLGMDEALDLDADSVSPEDIHLIIEKSGKFQKISLP